jgi:hypothetical protein
MPHSRHCLLFSIALLCTAAAPARATTMGRPLSLEQVVAAADRIVVGSVVDVRLGRDPEGVPATWITLAVSHTLRGPARRQFAIKQFGLAEPLADGTLLRLPGMPRYRPGDEVVIFLRRESERGFTSPVGLDQGVYRVDRAHGQPLVRSDLPGRATEELDRFLDRVERLARGIH